MSVFEVYSVEDKDVTAPTSKHDATETFRISSGKVPCIMHFGTMWRWWVDRFTLCENTVWYPQRWSRGWGSVQIKILIMLQIWEESAQCFWTGQCTQLQCVYTVKEKCFTNQQQHILYTLRTSQRIHSRGHQIFHLQYSIRTGNIPTVIHEATTHTSATLPTSLVAEPGGCTLTLNMVINQLHHFLKITLNVILSPPVWSSMKFPTRIQITCSSLYAKRSAHHNLTGLLQ